LASAKVIASASEKYHVIMAGRSQEKLKSAKAEIQDAGIKCSLSTLLLDVTNEMSIEEAARNVREQHGRLDVLINNAAVGSIDPNVATRFKLCMDTNVIGPAMVADTFRPLLLESQDPYSIFVSSGAGSLTLTSAPDAVSHMPNENAYRASKAALNMIAIKERQDFGSKGLKVFAFCPGFVVSNLRGPSEDARTGWGKAGDPAVSGQALLDIIEGRRDVDEGKFVHKDGVYPW
jgi:NAD(P)-dependent dehydrogenase (short-subunit alcohol dehydrogenase family)